MKTNIRNTALVIISLLVTFHTQAQTIYDGLRMSERNYEGTARSVAMGNAFTALGGDLGSTGINPAGSAVSKYSQFALTPSLTITSNTARFTPDATNSYRNTTANTNLPNIGFNFYWETGRSYGLKGISFGFISNQTNSWNEDMYAAYRNSNTSFAGALAANTTDLKYSSSRLSGDSAYDDHSWKNVIGFQSGIISTFDGRDDEYAGANEVLIRHNDGSIEIALGGPLDQRYGRQAHGTRNDYLFNVGFNISDFLFIGANLGITSMDYSYNEYFKEEAIDQTDFEIDLENGERMYFNDLKYTHSFNCHSTGVYSKIGIIVTPGYGLRFGAAIQTPTASTVYESWEMSGETNFSTDKYSSSALSPYGKDEYSFREPWRANFGIAYTLGKLAVFSADYEFCDYTAMSFRRDGLNDGREYFEDMNVEIKKTFRTSHMLRAGVEVKPIDRLAVRAGYNLTTSPDKEFYAPALDTYEAAKGMGWIAGRSTSSVHNVSFGLGLITRKSFYADIACRYMFAQDEYFMPYDNYIFDDNGMPASNAEAPVIINKVDAWKVLLTLGWRF